jgi:hypothetical protein
MHSWYSSQFWQFIILLVHINDLEEHATFTFRAEMSRLYSISTLQESWSLNPMRGQRSRIWPRPIGALNMKFKENSVTLTSPVHAFINLDWIFSSPTHCGLQWPPPLRRDYVNKLHAYFAHENMNLLMWPSRGGSMLLRNLKPTLCQSIEDTIWWVTITKIVLTSTICEKVWI